MMNKIEFKTKEEFFAYINSAVWVIEPEALTKAVYSFHEKIASGKTLKEAYPESSYDGYGYDVVGKVAVIHVKGIIEKDFIYGWSEASTEMIAQDLQNALNDKAIETIVLNIDSPGGTIPGVKELSDMVYNARNVKPVLAFSDTLMTSAAYWVGSGAKKIYGTDTAYFGSIGVFTTHVDFSGLLSKFGINVSLIKAGKYKTVGNPFGALSESDREIIQTRVNKSYDIFVEAIARNRGKEVEDVKTNMAEGRVFNGRDSIGAGLVDELVTLQDLVNLLHIDDPGIFIQTKQGENLMDFKVTKDMLQEKFPDVYSAVKAEGAAEEKKHSEAAIKTAQQETAKVEQERAKKILALADDTQKQLALDLYSQGKTVEEATAALLKSSQTAKAKALADFGKDAPTAAIKGGDEDDRIEAALYESYLKKFGDDKTFAAQYEKCGGKAAMLEHLKEWKTKENVREDFGNNIDSFLATRRAGR